MRHKCNAMRTRTSNSLTRLQIAVRVLGGMFNKSASPVYRSPRNQLQLPVSNARQMSNLAGAR